MSSAQSAKDRTLIAVIGDEVSTASPSATSHTTKLFSEETGFHHGPAPRRDRTRQPAIKEELSHGRRQSVTLLPSGRVTGAD